MASYVPMQISWSSPTCGVLKVNTHVAFSTGNIDFGILIWNYMGIPFLAKSLPHARNPKIEYGELISIIEGLLWSGVLLEVHS